MTARIQRKRVKGWRKPEGAVYIGYGSKYGNPFKWKDLPGGKKEAQDKFRVWLPGAIESGEYEIESLRDKIIMCYCSSDDPCHGDIIIKYLNNNDIGCDRSATARQGIIPPQSCRPAQLYYINENARELRIMNRHNEREKISSITT